MQVNNINNNYPPKIIPYKPLNTLNGQNTPSFKGAALGSGALAHKMANGKFLKWLLPAADKNTLAIEALYALLITCMLRPAVTLLTPAKTDADKEKNKFRAAHAIASGVIGFIFTMCISHPMSAAVDKVMNTKLPDGTFKYIKKYTGQLTENGGKPFKELAKRIHQPAFMPIRGMLTVKIVPPILLALGLSKKSPSKESFKAEPQKNDMSKSESMSYTSQLIQNPNLTSVMRKEFDNNSVLNNKNSSLNTADIQTNSSTPSFKGAGYEKLTDALATGIGKVVDTKGFSKLSHNLGKSKLYLPHLIALESLWLSTFYVLGALKNDKVSKEQKKTEVWYQALVTSFSAIGAYTLDSVVNKAINNFGKTFAEVNKNMPSDQLNRSLNGLKNLKSLVIFATIYRFIGPVLLNPIANKITGRKKGEQKAPAQSLTTNVNSTEVKPAVNKGIQVKA